MAGRGRLNHIDLLPEECGPIVAWAADQLQDRDRTQTEIYSEFVSKLQALEREYRGELDIKIPSFSAFNRYSIKLANMTRRLDETREIATAIAGKFDPEASDNLTLIAAEAIKSLVFEMMTNPKGIDPKGAMALAQALRSATQAQTVSTDRRRKAEDEFKKQAEQAVAAVAKSRGLTAETAEAILTQILGVDKT
jgi:hypothetical protein